MLSGTRWRIIDAHKVLNAMRCLATDGRHYPPVAMMEVAALVLEHLQPHGP